MKLLIASLLLTTIASAQIQCRFTHDTLSQSAAVGKVHGLQYEIIVCSNVGPAPRTLAFPQLMLAAPINLVPATDAQAIIGAKIARSGWGKVAHIAAIAGEFIVVGVAIASRNGSISTSAMLDITLVGAGLTGVDQIASMNLPSATGLFNQLAYPVTLGPAGSATAYIVDHEWATGWTKKPQSVPVVVIP